MSKSVHPTDKQPVEDRATAKLKRQQQRIIDNDAALVASRSGNRRKPKTEWKPFSLANSSDDNLSMSDSAESRVPTPFDVHAKVFKPKVATSSDSSSAPPLNSSRAPAGTLHPSSMLAAEDDEEGGFQLVTGRKSKAPPRPAPAPLAHHTYESDPGPVQSVAASFNKKEVNDIFGNDLPPPEFVQATPGLKEGQVQFVIHPNGDVAAQQWSVDGFNWDNIGQWSNHRQRCEGMMAVIRLKGETEQQALMQNSLAYFRAAAKQCEADVMKLPWGPKEISEYLPTAAPSSIPKARAKPDETAQELREESTQNFLNTLASKTRATPDGRPEESSEESAQKSINPVTRHDFVMPQKIRMPLRPRRRPAATGAPVMPMLPHADTNSSLDNMSFGGFPAASVQGVDPLWYTFGPSPSTFTTQQQHLSPGPTSSYADDQSWIIGMQGLSDHGLSPPKPSVYGGPPPRLGRSTPLDATSPPFVITGSGHVASQQVAVPLLDDIWQKPKRTSMRDSLTKLGITASLRAESASAASRTVLHDPLRDEVLSSYKASPLGVSPSFECESSFDECGGVSLAAGVAALDTSFLPALDTGDARRQLFFVSEPDPDPSPWNPPRAVDLGDTEKSSSLSDAQLAILQPPSPQNWKGPFFQTNPQETAQKKSHDEELRDWFTGGDTRARHDMMYSRIKAAHMAAAVKNPGPIKPPGLATSTGSHTASRDSSDLDKGITRLLIPVLENLASYVQGPLEKRRGPFARYAPPPEWCIDRGPNGNKSFFEANWGQPPERIGRDSRYRPLAYDEERSYGGVGSGGFEAPATPAAIGSSTGLGRSMQPLEGRHKVGGGARKW